MRTAVLFLFVIVFSFAGLRAQGERVLVFHKTEGYRHESISAGIQTIEEMGRETDFSVTETKDAAEFSEEKLAGYQLVIFLNTSGNVLNESQQKAFENYMSAGGNYLGVHAAADTEFEWEWYGKLVGAYFVDHPPIQEAKIIVEKPEHQMAGHLPGIWKRTDEWYNYREINPEICVVLRLDEDSYEGGTNGKFHPIAWYRDLLGGGKAIYTGGGHTEQSYTEPAFRKHLLESILFALRP